jgi:hypothetical protein
MGDGGSIPEALALPFADDLELLRSKGSGRDPAGVGFRFGEACPSVPLVYDDIRLLETCGVEIARDENPGRLMMTLPGMKSLLDSLSILESIFKLSGIEDLRSFFLCSSDDP